MSSKVACGFAYHLAYVIFLFNIRDYIKGFANGCKKRYRDVLGQEKPDV